MTLYASYEILLAVPLLILVHYLSECYRRKKMNLPPGPTPYPLIGNFLDIPKECEWLHWAKLKDIYGPIVYVRVFGQDIIILNDKKMAFDLLEKRSSIYSGRPFLKFTSDLCAWGGTVALTQFGPRLKTMRRNLHQEIGTRSAEARFDCVKEAEACRFLINLLNGSGSLFHNVRKSVGSIILRIAYGYVAEKEGKDPLVDVVEAAALVFSVSAQPGRWPVDAFPALALIPEWFPGAGFKRYAKQARASVLAHMEVPYRFTLRKLANGTARPCYMSRLIEKGFKGDEEDIAKWSASSLFVAGSDTSVSALCTFFLTMILYPKVQEKAQQELDTVVGNDRLPNLTDRDSLPYIEAIVKETLRWHPVTPMGLPHTATQDDVYEGYHIPKGSIIMPNIWQFTQDSLTYHNPSDFIPERYIAVDGYQPEFDPVDLIFGFGRRICIGKEFARSSIFLMIATTLSVFNIRRARDEHDREIEPRVDYMSGILSHPKEFPYSISPRSDKSIDLLRAIEEEMLQETGDAASLEGLL